jgi:hypothetical protein
MFLHASSIDLHINFFFDQIENMLQPNVVTSNWFRVRGRYEVFVCDPEIRRKVGRFSQQLGRLTARNTKLTSRLAI